MNHWERINAVLAGEAVDRLPVSVWRHRPTLDQKDDEWVEEKIKEQQRKEREIKKVKSKSNKSEEEWG